MRRPDGRAGGVYIHAHPGNQLCDTEMGRQAGARVQE